MKNMVKLVGIITVVAIIGLSMTACGDDSDNPELTNFIIVTSEDGVAGRWNPITSFSSNQAIGFGFRGNSPDLTVERVVINARSSEAVVFSHTRELNRSLFASSFEQFVGSWTFTQAPIGNYTAEIYFVDARGRRSNSRTVAFEIR
jgi:hypothetical protein